MVGSLFVSILFAYMIGYLFRCISAVIVIACPVFKSLFDGTGYLSYLEKWEHGYNLPMLYKTETWHYRCIEEPIFSFFMGIAMVWGLLSIISLLSKAFLGLLRKITKQNEFLHFIAFLGIMLPLMDDIDFYMIFRIWRFTFYRAYLILVAFVLLSSIVLYYLILRFSLKMNDTTRINSAIKLNLKFYFIFLMSCCVILLLTRAIRACNI